MMENERKDPIEMASIGSKSDKYFSGYCKVDNSMYIFQAKFNKETSKSGINGGRICKLCITHVEEAGKPIDQRVVTEYDNSWSIQPQNDNEHMACTAVILRVEILSEGLYTSQH